MLRESSIAQTPCIGLESVAKTRIRPLKPTQPKEGPPALEPATAKKANEANDANATSIHLVTGLKTTWVKSNIQEEFHDRQRPGVDRNH